MPFRFVFCQNKSYPAVATSRTVDPCLILSVVETLSGPTQSYRYQVFLARASAKADCFHFLTIPSNSCGRNNGVAHSVQVDSTILL